MIEQNESEQTNASAPAVASGELLADIVGPHEGDGRGNISVPAREWGFVQSLFAGQSKVFAVLGKMAFEGDTLLAVMVDRPAAERFAEACRNPADDEIAYDEVTVQSWRLGVPAEDSDNTEPTGGSPVR